MSLMPCPPKLRQSSMKSDILTEGREKRLADASVLELSTRPITMKPTQSSTFPIPKLMPWADSRSAVGNQWHVCHGRLFVLLNALKVHHHCPKFT